MTLEQFIATKRWSDDLAHDFPDDAWGDEDTCHMRGNVYIDSLYIEEVGKTWPWTTRQQGSWYLRLGNQEYLSFDLPELERILYDYADGEFFTADRVDDAA